MRYLILLAGIVFAVSAADAEIYQWTDKSGEMHFTDNPDKIPHGYRGKVKEIEATPIIQESEQPPKEQPTTVQNGSKLYGGHDEQWWRSNFSAIRNEIKVLQDNLPEKKKQLEETRRKRIIYQKPTDRVAYYDKYNDIQNDEKKIDNLNKRLADLDAQATRAGVPSDWRRE